MGNQTYKIIIGVSVGIAVGILIGCGALIVIRLYKKRSYDQHQSRDLSIASVPIRVNGVNTSIDSSATLSGSGTNSGFQYMAKRNANTKDLFASLSGIPRYSYKDIQKATKNFTTVLGQGSFGPVYKAAMPTGELVAVKVLSSNSSQGEKEFQTEVLLLSRLHHRNLVNLVGYCVDKSQRMLIYEFMTNGNLASFLYSDNPRILSWEERLQIASDVSHGIEYLHEGAIPPVIHRDLKSANILLDKSMRAKRQQSVRRQRRAATAVSGAEARAASSGRHERRQWQRLRAATAASSDSGGRSRSGEQREVRASTAAAFASNDNGEQRAASSGSGSRRAEQERSGSKSGEQREARAATAAAFASSGRRERRQWRAAGSGSGATTATMVRVGLSLILVLVGSIEPTNHRRPNQDRTRLKILVRSPWLTQALARSAQRLGSGECPSGASLKRAAWKISEALGPRPSA
ncbi:hypothetical protein C4D60_Mb05t24450 [Musa balbisiana]|uniref:Protein kinase domain-containing protein n=1 Tax=Musa balbisiana TaxID=52838 RepID=A0A4S8JYJ1_MUSBA|nr:hypothetical protein C4D60_Mb05t24450 [Musa balbisiana]